MLAGGCFWCLDAVYRSLRGVTDVVSGYTGGTDPDPTYERVSTGDTGHAQAVAVTFDETIIPPEIILDAYFTLHDPTQLNRQGDDIGTQYRSAMFHRDPAQRALFQAAADRAAHWWDARIVTEITPMGTFHRAEDEHQNFFARNPEEGYCLAVTQPKVLKVRKRFTDYLR